MTEEKESIQSLWRFAKESGAADHFARPHITHEPTNMPNGASNEITCCSLEGAAEYPGKGDEGDGEIGR